MTPRHCRADLLIRGIISLACLAIPVAVLAAPPTGSPSEDAMRLALELLGAALLLALAWRGRFDVAPPQRPHLVTLGVFAAWLVFTSLVSRWPLGSLAALWPTLVGVGFAVAILARPLSARDVAVWWTLLGVGAGLACLVALLPGNPMGWAIGDRPERFTSSATFGNPEGFASYLAPVLCLGLARLLAPPRPRPGLALTLAGACAVGLIALLHTASRGPALALVAALAVTAVLIHGRRLLRVPGLVAVLGGAALLGVVHIGLGDRSPAAGLVARLGQTFNPHFGSTHHRLTVWTLSAGLLWQRPVIGWGWGTYEFTFQEELLRRVQEDTEGFWELEARQLQGQIPYHAHNDYLEVAIAAGLPGLLLLLWILASALTAAERASRGAGVSLHAGVLAALLCLAAEAAVSFPLQRAAHLTLFWILAGVALRSPISTAPPRGSSS